MDSDEKTDDQGYLPAHRWSTKKSALTGMVVALAMGLVNPIIMHWTGEVIPQEFPVNLSSFVLMFLIGTFGHALVIAPFFCLLAIAMNYINKRRKVAAKVKNTALNRVFSKIFWQTST